jgi:prepilin-type N-terminal cleavage/methylation domain-containing protein
MITSIAVYGSKIRMRAPVQPTFCAALGFTLLEMSIVLVIIALIVAGVLVGRDLIATAEVRATVGQIEKYNSATNTFKTKFNGIPGDLAAGFATSFGFTTRAGTTGRGDGNGLIESTGGANLSQVYGQENGMFWNDLSVANLIGGQFIGPGNRDNPVPVAVPAAQVPTTFPAARLGRGNYITVGSVRRINDYLIAGIDDTVVTTGAYSVTPRITPIEAFNMDNKLDDGQPNTGILQAKGNATSTTTVFTDTAAWAAASALGNCIMGGTTATDSTAVYNLRLSSGGSSPACMVRIRFN